MQQMIRGQKTKISDLTSSLNLEVGICINYEGEGEADIACFGVDSQNQLSDDRYFVFYNQPSSPQGEIRKLGAKYPDSERFSINLASLPSSIVKLVFTASIDGSGSMADLSEGFVRVSVPGGGELARFPFSGSDFNKEKAVILTEIYLKSVWRLSAVGQGFNGGLSALLKYYGGEEDEDEAETAPPSQPAQPAQQRQSTSSPMFQQAQPAQQRQSTSSPMFQQAQPAQQRQSTSSPMFQQAQPAQQRQSTSSPMFQQAQTAQQRQSTSSPMFQQAQPAQQRQSTSSPMFQQAQPAQQAGTMQNTAVPAKITLRRQGQSQPIPAREVSPGTPLKAVLTWDKAISVRTGRSMSPWQRVPVDVEMTFGAMITASDGRASIVQSSSRFPGSASALPCISVDENRRTANELTLLIHRPDAFRRLLIFANMRKRGASYEALQAKVTIISSSGTEITIPLGGRDSEQPFCAAVMLNADPNSLTAVKEERYFLRHREADANYHFGLSW